MSPLSFPRRCSSFRWKNQFNKSILYWVAGNHFYSIQLVNCEITNPRFWSFRPDNQIQQVNKEITHPVIRKVMKNIPNQQVNEVCRWGNYFFFFSQFIKSTAKSARTPTSKETEHLGRKSQFNKSKNETSILRMFRQNMSYQRVNGEKYPH